MADGQALVHAAFLEASKDKPTITEMFETARAEAARIEIVQAGLIDAGMRTEPDPGQIRTLVVWDAIEKLTALFARHEDRAKPFFRDLENQRRRG